MITFEKGLNQLTLVYRPDDSAEWVFKKIDDTGYLTIAKTFRCTNNELLTAYHPDNNYQHVDFVVALLEGDYYKFSKTVMNIDHDLYIHKDITFARKLFVAARGISIFRKLGAIVDSSIYLGGNNKDAIPITVYSDLIENFPNSYELDKYAEARISSVISSYVDTKEDYESKYNNYLNKKVSKVGGNLQVQFAKIELLKYKTMLTKLQTMLDEEDSYTESQWQIELLHIILLLYPKYIRVFKEAPVRDTYNNKNRSIDYLLIDSSGNTDIIEIKKPFDQCIVTKRTYRDNFIPLRELSGTVMQVEKYIFYLNKWGLKGEVKLTEHYKDDLPKNFNIKITNPSGFIIMGRKKGLTEEQLQDFEVIKRKYKNVIDIVTYDDLIERLSFTIEQWSTVDSKSSSH
ncbi:Shedu immune nuclease family protein [Shewanella woodyi]|uniref:Shedu immune nuclease family protein n=1 Tax=Shewanella woodyi TaxID=60961 RepID=UPI00374932D7